MRKRLTAAMDATESVMAAGEGEGEKLIGCAAAAAAGLQHFASAEQLSEEDDDEGAAGLALRCWVLSMPVLETL